MIWFFYNIKTKDNVLKQITDIQEHTGRTKK